MTDIKIKRSIIDLLKMEEKLTMNNIINHFEEIGTGISKNAIISCMYKLISEKELKYEKDINSNRYYYSLKN